MPNQEYLKRKEDREHSPENRESHPISKKNPPSWKNSESTWHTYGEMDNKRNKEVTGYHMTAGEQKDESNKLHEMIKLDNAFGNIAMGSNKKKEFVVSMSEKKAYNSNTIDSNKKVVEGKRSKIIRGGYGVLQTNLKTPQSSAVLYRGNVNMMESKMIQKIKEFESQQNQSLISNVASFISRNKDERKLKELEEISRNIKENRGFDSKELDSDKARIRNEIANKRQMEIQVQGKIKQAIKKSKRIMSSNEFVNKWNDNPEINQIEDNPEDIEGKPENSQNEANENIDNMSQNSEKNNKIEKKVK